jgi:hypothetical protein
VANTIVRRGRRPARASSATARAASSTLTVPLTLSAAPGPQPSRCAPIITSSSGSSAPRTTAKVFHTSLYAAVARSSATRTRARTGPGPAWYRNGSPPCHGCGMAAPRTPASSFCAFPYEMGTTGMRGTRSESAGRRRAFAVLGQPGVLGSPVPLYTLPRCTPAAGRIGPSG